MLPRRFLHVCLVCLAFAALAGCSTQSYHRGKHDVDFSPETSRQLSHQQAWAELKSLGMVKPITYEALVDTGHRRVYDPQTNSYSLVATSAVSHRTESLAHVLNSGDYEVELLQNEEDGLYHVNCIYQDSRTELLNTDSRNDAERGAAALLAFDGALVRID